MLERIVAVSLVPFWITATSATLTIAAAHEVADRLSKPLKNLGRRG